MSIRLKPLTEKAFMAQVIQLARLHSWREYHTNDSRHSVSGFPDLVLARSRGPVRLLVAELKVGSNKPTAAQWEWLKAFELANVPVYVWYPEDWHSIEKELSR